MSVMDSFDQFEGKFGPPKQYAKLPARLAADLTKRGFPDYYVRYLETHGLAEFFNGFWWFTNPLELHEDLAPFAAGNDVFPVARNAFGCFLVRHGEDYRHLNPHVKTFTVLSDELALILNMTMTDAFALRDMYFFDAFKPAFDRVGKVGADEMYAFAPALKIGGTTDPASVHIVKMREHLAFLAQL
jgi:hypothetical protein